MQSPKIAKLQKQTMEIGSQIVLLTSTPVTMHLTHAHDAAADGDDGK